MQRSYHEGARILVVDDNPAMLRLIRSLLEDEGMTVIVVQSVREARQALQASGDHAFDLVLSDIAMPEEDGFQLLQWIKREDSAYQDVPVLLMTAQLPEPEYRVKCLAMGAVDYVERPRDTSELVLRAINAVEHYRRLRSLEMSLQDSEKLATVGRLLAASNHEIKNLVTLVRLASEQLAKQWSGGNANQLKSLALLDQASSLLVQVTKSTSFLLAPESSTSQTLDLAVIVRAVVSLLSKRVAPIFLDFAETTPSMWIFGHEVGIKQILINLVLNAYDAINELTCDSGGHIRLELVVGDGDDRMVRVSDNGIGLSNCGERSQFEPFVSTKRLRGGSGLGLWLSSTLAHNMGGSLLLRSEGPGLGATAELKLKAAPTPKHEAEIDLSGYLVELEELST